MSKGIISWKDILQAGDRESLDRRAERLSEILVEYKPVLHHRVKGPPSRAIDYRREAESSYLGDRLVPWGATHPGSPLPSK